MFAFVMLSSPSRRTPEQRRCSALTLLLFECLLQMRSAAVNLYTAVSEWDLVLQLGCREGRQWNGLPRVEVCKKSVDVTLSAMVCSCLRRGVMVGPDDLSALSSLNDSMAGPTTLPDQEPWGRQHTNRKAQIATFLKTYCWEILQRQLHKCTCGWRAYLSYSFH